MTSPESPQDRLAALEARFIRLEEAAGFADRTVDQLSEEIRLVNARLHDVSRRLERLEGRLGGVVERIEKFEQDRGSEQD